MAVAPPGQYALAAVQASFGRRRSPSELAVLRLGSRSRAPQLVRTFRLPRSLSSMGLAISRNGKYLAVAASVATAVLSLPALLAGRPDALLGILRDGESGVIEVTLSATGKFLFVSDEGSSVISVFNLARALLGGFSAPGVAVGRVTLGFAVVGSALSPNGRLLYVTSEVSRHNAGRARGILARGRIARLRPPPVATYHEEARET
ncbi:MAG: YncE family protein [Streptosporangiaceae bacterium]